MSLYMSIYKSNDQVILPEGTVVEVLSAEHVSDYKLLLSFSDGATRLIDFEPFLHCSSNPHIRLYLDPIRFKCFRVEHGDLLWDDYGLCFPIADLYENRI
jgi:hypothetical protein